MIEKAENLGLEFDKPFLQHYLPCFNSTLNDSMTMMYKVMGPYVRPIGQQLADGEAIHQSVLDRINLPVCQYDPQNLREHLGRGGPRVTNTQRISRGTPC